MSIATDQSPETSAGSTKPLSLDPAVVVALEILVAAFCDRETYNPHDCDPYCRVCKDAMASRKEGHA